MKNDKYVFYRDFGDLSNDSVVCDIYKKRIEKQSKVMTCYKCKYFTKTFEYEKFCKYIHKALKEIKTHCLYYHRKPVVSKTKKMAIERWNKYLNNKYYQEHKGELSKSQIKKVDEWRSTHKTYN